MVTELLRSPRTPGMDGTLSERSDSRGGESRERTREVGGVGAEPAGLMMDGLHVRGTEHRGWGCGCCVRQKPGGRRTTHGRRRRRRGRCGSERMSYVWVELS